MRKRVKLLRQKLSRFVMLRDVQQLTERRVFVCRVRKLDFKKEEEEEKERERCKEEEEKEEGKDREMHMEMGTTNLGIKNLS